MSLFIHGLLAGFFIGVGTCGAFVLHRLQRRPKMPTLRRARVNGWQPLPQTRMPPPPMPKAKPVREPDLADVGGVGDQPIYMYGVTGEER
jgi:hypothetical protein